MDVTKEALELELARTVNKMQKEVGDRDHIIEILEKELERLREQNASLTRFAAIFMNAKPVPLREADDQERPPRDTTVDETPGAPVPSASVGRSRPSGEPAVPVRDPKPRLYRVEVKTEVYCVAESAEQAARIAQRNTRDEQFDTRATLAEWVSPDWGNCMPYTAPGVDVVGRTCDEWLQDGG